MERLSVRRGRDTVEGKGERREKTCTEPSREGRLGKKGKRAEGKDLSA